MKKSIILIASIIFIKLAAFATNENLDKIVVASFEIENTASTAKQIKISSITNSNEETIYQIAPSSKLVFEIEKSQKAWEESQIKIIDGTDEHEIESALIYKEDTISAHREKASVVHEKQFDDELGKSNDFIENTSSALSLVNPKTHDLFINNKFLKITYEVTEDEEELEEDEKIYKKVKVMIISEGESLILQLDSSQESNRKQLAPFFYEITGNNIDPSNPVYLLGTCHILSPEDYSQKIRNKIENTEILISEFPEDASHKTMPEYTLETTKFVYEQFLAQNLYWFRDQFMAIGYEPDEVKEKLQLIQEKRNELENATFFASWFSEFTEEEQEIIKKIASEAEIELISMHPGIMSSLISATNVESFGKEYVEDSLEIYLIKYFIKNSKEIVYLDTSETLLWAYTDDFFTCMSKSTDLSIQSLKSSIEKYNQCDSLEWDCWEAGAYFDALDFDAMIAYPMDLSTNARNRAWKEKVMQALSFGKSASIITGSEHLKAETGFINLLKTHGYHIKHAYIEVNEDSNKELKRMNNFRNWKEDIALKSEKARLLNEAKDLLRLKS